MTKIEDFSPKVIWICEYQFGRQGLLLLEFCFKAYWENYDVQLLTKKQMFIWKEHCLFFHCDIPPSWSDEALVTVSAQIDTLIDTFVRDNHAKHEPVSNSGKASGHNSVSNTKCYGFLFPIYFLHPSTQLILWPIVSGHELSTSHAPLPQHSQPSYLSAPDQAGGSRSRSVMWWTMLVSVIQEIDGVVLRASKVPWSIVPPHQIR